MIYTYELADGGEISHDKITDDSSKPNVFLTSISYVS
jgi:hypothetical protein